MIWLVLWPVMSMPISKSSSFRIVDIVFLSNVFLHEYSDGIKSDQE